MTKQSENQGDVILTVYEASRLLKLSEKTVRDLAKAGEIPYWKIGLQYRFSRQALLDRCRGVTK